MMIGRSGRPVGVEEGNQARHETANDSRRDGGNHGASRFGGLLLSRFYPEAFLPFNPFVQPTKPKKE